jgi:hypothetical protein
VTSRDALAPIPSGASGGAAGPGGAGNGGTGTTRPAFALRFDRGRGILALARPLRFSIGTIDALELDLGRLPPRIDLRAGPSRFRHRSARALRATLRIDLDALARTPAEAVREVSFLDDIGGAIGVAMRDRVRTIALSLVPSWDGRDLLLALRDVRAALEGPRPAIVDALQTLVALPSVVLDRDRGLLRIDDPIRQALTEALVPHGWRVPEVAGARRVAPTIERRALVLAILAEGDADVAARATASRDAIEEALLNATILDALAADRVEDADRRLAALETRPGVASIELDAIAAELALFAGRPLSRAPEGHTGATLLFRDALRRRDVERASFHARAIAATEPCDGVAIDALRGASALAAESRDPGAALDLASRALARRPRDPALALEWLSRAEHAPDPASLLEGVHAIHASVAGPARAEVLTACAAVLDRIGEHGEARSEWEEASRLAPDDPIALEGLATSLGLALRNDESLSMWDRLASVLAGKDPNGEARALLRAAGRARAVERSAGAAARLERAVEIATDDMVRVEALALLAEVRRELGARGAAADADAALLELASRGRGPAIVAALHTATKAAIEDRAEVRGRAFLAALRRLGAPPEPVREVEQALDALEIEALEREAPEHSDRDPGERALRARAIAEHLRAAGRAADAARALARAGVIARDAATLDAALELAARADAWDAALEVIDRALELAGDGPDRARLEARREEIRRRR